MSVSSDLSRCERVYQNQTPWYGNPPPSTKKINRASSIFPKDLKDQDQDWGNFDRTQFWQHYFAPWMNSHSIDILGILPTSELILASSISSEGSANQDQVGGNFNHTRFWHDFFTLWMISESISVFPRQDDDMGRSPELCVGSWLRDEWHSSLPAESGIILAVACFREGERIDELANTQVLWAMQRLYMHNQVWKSEERQRIHCSATRVVWYQPVIWVAITAGKKIYFHRVKVEAVWRPTTTGELRYEGFQWALESWISMSLELELSCRQLISIMNRIVDDHRIYLRTF